MFFKSRRSVLIGPWTFGLALLAVVCLALTSHVGAQMPDPKQMSGIPRPVDDLPRGSVSVRLIKGDLSNNIAGHPVEMLVDGQVRTVTTDAEGRAQFDSLPAGSTVQAIAVVDGERLESQAFPAPTDGAIRVMLVATDKAREQEKAAAASIPAVPGDVVIAGESRFVIEPGDEALEVFYILEILNPALTPVNPPVPIVFDMPEGLAGTTVLQGSSPLASANGRRVTVAGPFPPGKTAVEVGGSLPVTSDTVQFTQTFPVTFEQPVFIAKKEGAMTISSPQFDRRQETAVEGTPVIIAVGDSVPAGQVIAITVSGLPYRSATPRLTALVLALGIIVVGVYFSLRPAVVPDRSEERRHLIARREKLLQELLRLEQDHRLGKVEAPRFASRREDLMGALETVYGALDGDDAAEGVHAASSLSVSRAGTS